MYDWVRRNVIMSVCIELPTDLEASLRSQIENLEATAKESFLVDLYRQERITHHQLASALGIDRMSLEEVLQRHGVVEDLPSVSELRKQFDDLDARLGR
jgi:predicted HTH domain antitoxin